MAEFPTTVYTQTDIVCPEDGETRLPKDISNAHKDEVVAVETKVGIDGDTNVDSHDYKLNTTASGNPLSATNKLVDTDFVDTAVASGWTVISQTLTFSSDNDPVFTATFFGEDLTAELREGSKLWVTQTTEKYFWVKNVELSGGNTIVTLWGGNDYDLVNAAITAVNYSYTVAPMSWPLDKAVWEVVVNPSNVIDNAPAGTVVNVGEVVVPIGGCELGFKADLEVDFDGVATVQGSGSLNVGYHTDDPSSPTGSFTVNQPFVANIGIGDNNDPTPIANIESSGTSNINAFFTSESTRTVYFNYTASASLTRATISSIRLTVLVYY